MSVKTKVAGVLTEKQLQVRVTFKDYGFFVKKEIQGKQVIAEGILSASRISEAEARHYATDAGKSQEEIEKIKGDQPEYRMIAESVLVPTSTKMEGPK